MATKKAQLRGRARGITENAANLGLVIGQTRGVRTVMRQSGTSTLALIDIIVRAAERMEHSCVWGVDEPGGVDWEEVSDSVAGQIIHHMENCGGLPSEEDVDRMVVKSKTRQ